MREPGPGVTSLTDCDEVKKATYATEMNVPVAATNDDFSAPIIIPGVPYISPNLDTTLATLSGSDPPFSCVSGQKFRTVWFRYTPAASGTYSIDTFGSDYDTVLEVFTGSAPP